MVPPHRLLYWREDLQHQFYPALEPAAAPLLGLRNRGHPKVDPTTLTRRKWDPRLHVVAYDGRRNTSIAASSSGADGPAGAGIGAGDEAERQYHGNGFFFL